MNLSEGRESEARFTAYVEGLASVVGHADRTSPLRDYCTGLILPGERKSVEPMAAKTAPGRTAAQHQSLLHFVGVAPMVRNYPHVLTGAGVKLKPVGDAEMVLRAFSGLVNDWPIEN